MLIAFSCTQCGHAYKVVESQAGKSGKCKRCGSKLTVPEAGPAAAPPDLYGLDDVAIEPAASALPRLGARGAPAARGGSPGRPLWPFALASGGAVLVVAALAVALVRSGPSGKTAEKAAEVLTTPLPEPAEPAKPIVLAPAVPGPGPDKETVRLHLLASGASSKYQGGANLGMVLTGVKPSGLTKAPALKAPIYGVIPFGLRDSPMQVTVVIDEPEDQPPRLYVDSNANGDLTDDPAIEWKLNTTDVARYHENNSISTGRATVELPLGGRTIPVHLKMTHHCLGRKNKNAPNGSAFKEILTYCSDYGYEGKISLGDAEYPAMLVDLSARGDFRGAAWAGGSSVQLMIDVNQNGQFDARSERFDVGKPFVVKGTPYEVAGMSASGSEFQIRKSDKSIAEITRAPNRVAAPPDIGVGRTALAFTARTTDGLEVRFPSSYAGKLVMLDFWATWCGPCIGELPYLTRAYDRFHDQRFEILGISLDPPNTAEKLASFTQEKNMTWRQLYDGKLWKAAVAELYGVRGIPHALLVDGDTGEILATGSSLRGNRLEQTLAEMLGKKGVLKPDRKGTTVFSPTAKAKVVSNIGSMRSGPGAAILARFPFNGDARDATGTGAAFQLKNTAFRDGALYLSGEYEHGTEGKGFHAVGATPALDYATFTVAMRFKAEAFASRKSTLLVGGTSYRWLVLGRSAEGRLTIGLNNRDFEREAPGTRIATDRWYVVACGFDLPKHRLVSYLDGRKVLDIALPRNFQLRAITDRVEGDKVWTFTNYASGNVFHGVVDELIVYNRMLTSEEFKKIPLRP